MGEIIIILLLCYSIWGWMGVAWAVIAGFVVAETMNDVAAHKAQKAWHARYELEQQEKKGMAQRKKWAEEDLEVQEFCKELGDSC